MRLEQEARDDAEVTAAATKRPEEIGVTVGTGRHEPSIPNPPAEPLPANEGVRTAVRNVAVVNPTAYFVQSLKDALVARGITVSGDAADIDDLPASASTTAGPSMRVLARTESQPLRDIGAVMMKVSQNLYAETLFKAAGLRAKGAGTAQAGRTAVLETLREWKLDERALVMLDGSGLSRYDYVSANLIAASLERLPADPQHRDAFTDLAREVFQGAVHGLRGIGAEIRRRSGRLRPYLHGARRHHLDCGVAPTGLLARPEHGS